MQLAARLPGCPSWNPIDGRVRGVSSLRTKSPFKRSLPGFTCRAQAPQRTNDPYYDIFAEQMRLSDRLHREIDAAQRQMDAEFDAAMQRAEEQQQAPVGGSAKTWKREWKSENGAGRMYFSESVTVFGPTHVGPALHHTTSAPSLSSPLILVASLILGFWAATTAAFSRRYHLTRYSEKWRWLLCMLWPVLALTSPSFRDQFEGAMRGRKRSNNKNQSSPVGNDLN